MTRTDFIYIHKEVEEMSSNIYSSELLLFMSGDSGDRKLPSRFHLSIKFKAIALKNVDSNVTDILLQKPSTTQRHRLVSHFKMFTEEFSDFP